MLTIIIALLLPAAHAQPDYSLADADVCFYYLRADYSRAEANAELKRFGVRTDVDAYCHVDARDLAHIEQLTQR